MTTAEEAATLAKALKANASNLGLTWNLRLATVKIAGVLASVLLDGDDAAAAPPIPAISLIGSVTMGARVMTLWVPPTTLFIIGVPGGTVAREMTNRVYKVATTNLTLTASPQLVPGATVTVSTVGAANWEVGGVFDFGQSVAGAASPTFSGYLYVDGVQQPTLALHQSSALGVNRQSTPQSWSGTFTAGGNHTFELRADVSAVSGTSVVRAASTTLLVKTYE